MVISFYFLIIFYRTIHWDHLKFFILAIHWDFVLEFFYFAFLGFFYWDFFIWTCYWDFLIWTFYGKFFIGTFYEYFFIGTFVAFILDLLSVLFLGLFSSMGFSHFFLLIVSIFERLFFLRPSKYPNLLLSHQGRCWLLDIYK